ncbi:MAG: chromosomal replication initiator protein DnaA, partial [Desulfobacterales bacterium]
MEMIWKKTVNALKDHIPSHSFRMWIEPLKYRQADEDQIVVTCPNLFSRRRVLDNYAGAIELEISRATGKQLKLSVEVSTGKGRKETKTDESTQLALPNISGHINRGRFLRKDFTFDRFVVSGNNDFAYSAALSLAFGKRTIQNSLFLLSKTGMGKSHLSQAVGNHILAQSPDERVFYVTADSFSNEMLDAMRNNRLDQFKKKYRNTCDVLLLEDLHYLPGKKKTQVELALILDVLLEAGKKIIFSSCLPPADIPGLNDKLASRLSGGLISTIEPPNYRTRVRILQKKSILNGFTLPEEVTQYLAGELLEDVRQLESGLIGVTSKAALMDVPIDLTLAEDVVKHLVSHRKKITINVVKTLICREYKVSARDLLSRSRKQGIVEPRQIAIYLSRLFTDAPLQEIGRSFNRYHATAIHSIGVIKRKLKESGAMRKQIELLSEKLDAPK